MGVGVAVLPRRCALTEIERGDLVAVKVPELKATRVVRFVFRRTGELSHAAAKFLQLVRERVGGWREYVLSLGVDPAALAAMQDNLVSQDGA